MRTIWRAPTGARRGWMAMTFAAIEAAGLEEWLGGIEDGTVGRRRTDPNRCDG